MSEPHTLGWAPVPTGRQASMRNVGPRREILWLYVGALLTDSDSTAEATLNLYWTARVIGGEPRAADDVSELQWFESDELPPPDELAFENVPLVLSAWRARHEHA